MVQGEERRESKYDTNEWFKVKKEKGIITASPPRVKETFFLFSFLFIGVGVPDVAIAPSERTFLEGAVSKGHCRRPCYIHPTVFFIPTRVCDSGRRVSHVKVF